ncbi:bifunctional aldehyde dehydrogenase/enoyl-CoA hydratase [Actinomadura sp. NBRC 104425]|uniref:phenylacetic acid degradation bifunctional protein PaaZ n=1 Tax=Actinomadura sp. NBRC 104425 TaxID=3032204 RepID=UPI0024A0B372|nr:phenylacetic acid degradation bifunctional protein PaaZ [Actinomadura sp. NBRC 104425]GLZ11624.1 bifunctional aldehyde dehydrogenase/enoyl-CoA hydratase [Actinomadura sp. NBRC 104425]
MTPVLRSYSHDTWQEGGGPARPLRDAATGEVVARLPATGPDPAAMLDHARRVGGPALRALTFQQRAAILKALARHLSDHAAEFAELSTRTGATRRDTAVDVQGGIGTLAVYASKAAAELPDAVVLADGPVEPLGRGGTFAGRHVLAPRLGAAVQINAFNFPVWGMLEKFAPAFLAGMPSVVKPAGPTAYLTELVVRRMTESGMLPEGTLSLLCAGPAGLLEGLTAQDTLSFTGSAATALKLRTHPAVAGRAVPFNAEADSLNCSVLGPDVTADDPEFTLFVDQIVTEMTVKAGQKCTAIRRAFVPAALADAVTEALAERLRRIVVGHPARQDTDMGPLVGLDQREEVRAAVAGLAAEAKIVFGDPLRVDAAGADPERGAFLSPILLRCDDPSAAAPHEIEAFGPVSTLLPYTGLDEVAAAAARGGGSLAGSIVTADPRVARTLVDGLAPWHGRLLVLNRDDAAESTGHGVAMPQLVHGGPGRAGGGEELGGLRALHHYMRRTAVQGHPGFLAGLA